MLYVLTVILCDGDERFLFEDTPAGRRAAAIKLADGYAQERKDRENGYDFIEAVVEKYSVDGETNIQERCHSAAYYYEDKTKRVLIDDKGWPEMHQELEKAWRKQTRKRKNQQE
jgi:uncharacterized protein HemY